MVSKVECSNTDLFYATDASGEWKVISCRAFSTDEWMKVTIGKLEYEITVTDEQEVIVGDLKYSIDNGVAIVTGPLYYGLTSETMTIEKEITYEDNKYSVKGIGYGAFQQCSSLKSITIPDSVESIGTNAFFNCSSLESITIPDSVESIGNSAFQQCSSLKSITIPKSVKNIGDYAFSNLSFDGSPEVFYGGTLEDWEKIAIGDSWISTAGSPVTFQCTYIAAVRPEGAGTAEGTMTIKNFIRPSEQRLTILDLTAKDNKGYYLLTRGMLGTYVYCEDEGLREHLKEMVREN